MVAPQSLNLNLPEDFQPPLSNMSPAFIAMNGSGLPPAESMNIRKPVDITEKISGVLNASEKNPSFRLHFLCIYAILQHIIIQKRPKP